MNKPRRILILEDDEAFEMWIRQNIAGAEFFVVTTLDDALTETSEVLAMIA